MTTDMVKPGDAILAEFLQSGKGSVVSDPQQAMMDILRRTAEATSVDDVLGQSEATHARDVIGVPLVFQSFRVQESTFGGEGPDFYYLADCVNRDGESIVVTCGAPRVMLQLWKLQQMEALPIELVIAELDHDTAAGFRPMWLERPSAF